MQIGMINLFKLLQINGFLKMFMHIYFHKSKDLWQLHKKRKFYRQKFLREAEPEWYRYP